MTATASGGNWSVTAASLATGTYTAQALQSDGAGNTGKSSVDTFTTVASLTQTTAGSYTVTVAPDMTSFAFTIKGAGGGGGGTLVIAAPQADSSPARSRSPIAPTPTQLTIIIGGGGGAGSNNTGGTSGSSGTGCAHGGARRRRLG